MSGQAKDIDQEAIEAGAPADFFCPICFRVLRDPVTSSSGETYDRQCIEDWLAQGHSVCPVTDQQLKEPVTIVSNVSKRKHIEEWFSKRLPHGLDEKGSLIAHTAPAYNILATTRLQPIEEDFALAIRLQEDELEQYSARHPGSAHQAPQRQQRADPFEAEEILSSRSSVRRRFVSRLNILLLLASFGMLAVFILSLWQGEWQIQGLSVNPMVGPDAEALSRLGSKVSQKIRDNNQYWRLVTSLFVSSGVIHLFSAVTSLWTLAKYLEYSRKVRRPEVTIPFLYLVSGIAGCLVSANVAFDHNSCGASAAVCGLLGGVWVEQLVNRRIYRNRIATLIVLVLLTGMFVVISLLPLVGMWYQVAALICGALLMPCLLKHHADARASPSWLCFMWLLRYSAALVVVAVITVGVLSLRLNRAAIASSCGTCLDMDCVQIRDWWTCNSLAVLQPQASCTFLRNSNATTTITCPSGFAHLVATNSLSDQIAACNAACSGTQTLSAPVAGPDSAGVLI